MLNHRIVQAFEAIATSLAEQEDFDSIIVVEEETVLAAERVRIWNTIIDCTIVMYIYDGPFHSFEMQAPLEELQMSGLTFAVDTENSMFYWPFSMLATCYVCIYLFCTSY